MLLHPAIGAASRRDIGADGYRGRRYLGVEVDAADDRGACGERCNDGRRPRPWNQAEAGEDRADEERRQRNQIAGLVGSARAVDEQHEDGCGDDHCFEHEATSNCDHASQHEETERE